MPRQNYTFTSESVSEGHPDKVCDRISDAVLDAFLAEEPEARVACETFATTNRVVIGGEVGLSDQAKLTEYMGQIDQIARDCIKDIGYEQDKFHHETVEVTNLLHEQSAHIAQGVNASENKDEGAGDQGMMFGYACDETPELMPLPIWTAHRMAERLAEVRHKGQVPYLRPDGKTQVAFEYEDGRPIGLKNVVISTQHQDGIDRDTVIRPDLIEQVINPVIPEQFAGDNYDIFINPTGRFVIGGPQGDCGLTGRKIIVDTYGGMGRHGGGAFSGKDPSKVDRSAAYAARWVAKHVVASGAASRCELQVAYAIGVAHPMSILVDTFGTEQVDPDAIVAAVREVFDLRPGAIVRDLDLLRPGYQRTAAYGHFGREGFSWETLSRLDEFKSAVGV